MHRRAVVKNWNIAGANNSPHSRKKKDSASGLKFFIVGQPQAERKTFLYLFRSIKTILFVGILLFGLTENTFAAAFLDTSLAVDSSLKIELQVPGNSSLPRIDINFYNDMFDNNNKDTNEDGTIDFYDLNKEDYFDAMVEVSNAGEYNVSSRLAGVRQRGNSTRDLPKRPVRIKFDKKTSMFGRGAEKSWVLLANYYDKSLLRNIIALNTYSYLGADFSSIAIPVDVYVNGIYHGVYNLCDQIQVATTRVNFDPVDDDALCDTIYVDGKKANGLLAPEDVNYFIESDARASTEGEKGVVWFETTISRGGYVIKAPDPDEYSVESTWNDYISYISDYMEQVKSALSPEESKSANWEEIQQFIDVDSFVTYLLTSEIMNRQDMSWSYYLSKPAGGKLRLGPQWDFDLMAGIGGQYRSPDSVLAAEDDIWFLNKLMQIPDFYSLFTNRFYEVNQDLLVYLNGLIDGMVAEHGEAFENDFQYWGIRAIYGHQAIRKSTEYDEQVQFLRDFVNYRINWLTWVYKLRNEDKMIYADESNLSSITINDDFTIDAETSFTIQKPFALSHPTFLNLNGTLTVPNGAKLTIESGAVIKGNGKLIINEGANVTLADKPLPAGTYSIDSINSLIPPSSKICTQILLDTPYEGEPAARQR